MLSAAKHNKHAGDAGEAEIMREPVRKCQVDVMGEGSVEKNRDVLRIFALSVRKILEGLDLDFGKLQEIRLRVGMPLILLYDNHEYLVDKKIVSREEINETVEYVCNYSVYAYEEELRQGFVTVQGGHRVGFAGKIVCENDRVKSIKNISFINVRLAHEVIGAANVILPYVYDKGFPMHTLIISPPGCGKTTILRDLVRSVSEGNAYAKGMTVGVVDERSEIAACYMGIPQNKIGMRTDVLDCCPKEKGMIMLIRSMSPKVIAVDEIGQSKDIEALKYVAGCGCKLFVTVHGTRLEDIKSKPFLQDTVKDEIWERYIVLDNVGHVGNINSIYDKKGIRLK